MAGQFDDDRTSEPRDVWLQDINHTTVDELLVAPAAVFVLRCREHAVRRLEGVRDCKKTVALSSFPYGCPEPVLVN